jgi:potassium/chloride transporter 4/5/6
MCSYMFNACDCKLPGKGLTLIGSVLEGDYAEKYADALAAKQTITALMKKEKVPGFAEVIVADSTVQGLGYL